jgi:hypothetical protein
MALPAVIAGVGRVGLAAARGAVRLGKGSKGKPGINVNVKSNIKQVLKETDRVYKKDLPKAFGKLIDKAAYSTAKLLSYATQRYFETPTPFITNSFGYWNTNQNQKKLNQKRSYVGIVGNRKFIKIGKTPSSIAATERRNKLFELQIFGGVRKPTNSKLIKPAKHSKLNQYGNLSRTLYGRAKANTNKFFIGTPKGMTDAKALGIYEKKKTGLKMVAKLDDTTTYSKRFPYYMIIKRNVPKVIRKEFPRLIRKYYNRKYNPHLKN